MKLMLLKNFTGWKMTKIIVIGILICSHAATAQTFDEWFRQKKTQRKYMVQQIAALKVYLGYLKDGYNIAKKGLTIVGDIKQGKFDLDMEYLASLKNVNPAVSGSAKVAGIITYQRAILIEFGNLRRKANETDLFTNDEKNYISRVYANMLEESESSVVELDRVLSNSDFEMKDDERVKRVDDLYIDMKDKYAFTKSFSNSTTLLIAQRASEEHEIAVQSELSLK
jgi:hypothetical protein